MEGGSEEEPTDLAITMDTTLSNLEVEPSSNKLNLDNESPEEEEEEEPEDDDPGDMSHMIDHSESQLVERTCSDQSLVKSLDSYSAATDSGVTSPELSHRGVSPGHTGGYGGSLMDENQYDDDVMDCNNG